MEHLSNKSLKLTLGQVADMYLDYFNNFLTLRRWSDYYELAEAEANTLWELGKLLQEQRARQSK